MRRPVKRFWIISFTLLLAFSVVLAGCGAKKSNNATSASKLAKQKTLVVATSGTLFPTSYHGTDNKLEGYDVDIARAVAKGLNKKIKFKELDVSATLNAVNSGVADMAVNDYGITKQRKKTFALSIPYKYSFNSMIVRKKDQSGIHSFADLKGKKAGGEAGTGYQRLATQIGAKAVNYDNVANDVYIRDVENGRLDVILNDYYLQRMAIRAIPGASKQLTIPKNLYFQVSDTSAGSGVLMKKQNTALQTAVNKELKKLLKDGTIKKISEKYYDGADVTHKPTVHIAKTFTLKN
ncbi:cystine transport system substrate-binding protein [Weissella beninensis]|uniref:Transporter substrate-binding domain-containing protein n=1 Tax=Periweissella beninensis TaxID=504936 RepID=A0ABT0VI70_9LACO|nr:transporter substrate-binding domain-containing protein [Periweissella beninensis]MBM7543373.1 cystine transport system substrate-binding protein [Periweissella beninensis]MCM2437330.1 transporter substrate-binding domain-containing protein [Periweissella beninensis]